MEGKIGGDRLPRNWMSGVRPLAPALEVGLLLLLLSLLLLLLVGTSILVSNVEGAPVSSENNGAPTSTISSTAVKCFTSTPETGLRMSTLTLSVSMTTTTSSTETASPSALIKSTTVPSLMESPMDGTGMISFSLLEELLVELKHDILGWWARTGIRTLDVRRDSEELGEPSGNEKELGKQDTGRTS